jgi:hypothetical protein
VTRDPLRFGRIVVIGGGCYGAWYTQQLTRAARNGALLADEVVVVDRNPACRVAERLPAGEYDGLPVRVERITWASYLAAWLDAAPEDLARDAMVPSPLMPHLCLDWLIERARTRWPDRAVAVQPLPSAPDMPWQREAPDGRHYVSFATWTCPVNCIEPVRCPATRGERDWSMPVALHRYVSERAATAVPAGKGSGDTRPLRGPVIFQCEHRTYGVGMIDAAVIARADAQLAVWGDEGPLAALVGTVSHCHGALGVLSVSPPSSHHITAPDPHVR